VVAGIALGAFVLSHHPGPGGGGSAQAGHHPSTSSHQAQVIKPVGAQGFDALSSEAQDHSNENTNQAQFAIDANPRSAWHTQYYFGNPKFGGLKAGTGLILDLGKPVQLSSVAVTFGSIPGADVRIELGNSNVRAPSTLGSFTTVAHADNVGGAHTFTVSSQAKGRYLLIWLTKLPPKSPSSTSRFMASVFNVVVRGSS
jgi:hypothetical protein